MKFFIFAALGALFLFNSGPAVQPFRDSGELLAVSMRLGIAHPPGYALYTFAGHLWTSLLPWGNVGYRLNTLSAFLMAAAATGLFGTLRQWGVFPWTAAAAAGAACLTRPNWTSATVSEPYALMAALTAWSVREAAAGRPAVAWLAGGLAICAHPFAVILVPILLLMHPSLTSHRLTPLIGLIGVAPLLALPIRAKADPILAWGENTTPAGFVRHLTRAEYQGLLLTNARPAVSREGGWDVLVRFANGFAHDLTLPVALAATGGLLAAVFLAPRPGAGLLAGFLLSGPGYALAAALPGDPLSQATLLPGRILPVMFALLGTGLALANLARPAVTAVTTGAAACALVLIHGPVVSRRWNFVAYDWASSILRGVDLNGIALLAGDRNLFPVWAAQAGGVRRDVEIVSPLLSRDWEVERLVRRGILPERSTVVTAMQDLVDRARGRRPVFVKHTVGALTRLDGEPSPTLDQLRRRTAVRLPRHATQDPYDRQIAEAMRW